MDETVKADIIDVLTTALNILKIREEKDVFELKKLSNRTIHDASIFQDEYSVSVAVSIYAISKIIERGGYVDKEVINILSSAKKFLLEDNTTWYRIAMKKLFEKISQLDIKLQLYIGEVINQAQIKKGSKLYEHGISLARAAEILGVSQWQLMDYLGKTQIPDETYERFGIRNRLKTARSIFGL